MDWLVRTSALIGIENLEKIRQTKIAILGLGGVGGAVAESLCRAGVQTMLLVDNDTVDISNLNRQLLTTTKVVGEKKTTIAKERILAINPHATILLKDCFYLPDTSDFLYEFQPDFIIDAIDTITAKLHIAKMCHQRNIPLISCLGTGNRLDPTLLKIGSIWDTSGLACPVARVMRKELRRQATPDLTVVFSSEKPATTICNNGENGRHSPASISCVPPVAGYFMGSHVIKQIIAK